MNERILMCSMTEKFMNYLHQEEKSRATIEKYGRDLKKFREFAGENFIDKQLVVDYKNFLAKSYAASSANSMLAAVNSFLQFMGWYDCRVKRLRVQSKAYCSEDEELTRAEYIKLVNTAKQDGNERLALLIQTICSTGIRVSELQHITVESLKEGEATVLCKGKVRTVFIVPELRRKLKCYTAKNKISFGPVFITRSGRPVDRSNIWREMKGLCKSAGVSPRKVFPHNLRHLFARLFYELDKDIAKLADVLGHASINTTRIYIATTGIEHRKKMQSMRLIL